MNAHRRRREKGLPHALLGYAARRPLRFPGGRGGAAEMYDEVLPEKQEMSIGNMFCRLVFDTINFEVRKD